MAKNRFLTGLLAVAVVLLQVPVPASAAAQPKGISLSPFLQQVAVEPGDIQKSFTITVTNHTPSIQELSLGTKDFGSLNETGGILLEGSKDYTQKYGLASWLTLERDTVTLQPEESANVLATIDNRSSLQPGGHYGAVVATVGKLDAAANNNVVLNQQLLALVLVNKVGGEHYDLKLVSARQNGNWLHLPNDVALRFQNPGNVHVIPRGVVRLKSPGGRVVAQGIVNDESAYILPESFREMHVALTPVGKGLPLPGTYHVEIEYRYEGIAKTATKSYTTFFLNLKGNFVLLLLASGLVWYWLRRKANMTAQKRKKSA